MSLHLSPLALVSFACAGIAAIILVTYLVRRPPLTGTVKVWLLLGLGVFPIGVAASGNIAGYEASKERRFCGSCHVMQLHTGDSSNPSSQTLAARHGRNPYFGSENCYACHEDYGMFGTITTKLGGMRHVWKYYTEFRNTPLEEAKNTIHLIAPYPNSNCMQCHSGTDQNWLKVTDHRSTLEDVKSGKVSCASGGCHGFAHPMTKPPPEEKQASDGEGRKNP